MAGSDGGFIDFQDATDGNDHAGRIIYAHSDDTMKFSTAGAQRLTITGGGSVGIGTATPAFSRTGGGLRIDNSDAPHIRLDNGSSNVSEIYQSGVNTVIDSRSPSGVIKFTVQDSEKMRLDSGNLLVGGTNTFPAGNNVVGTAIRPDGDISITKAGDFAIFANRKDSDGGIIDFRKDGTTVGSIKAGNGDLLIGTGDVNLRFFDATPAVIPRTASDGTSSAVVDLGNVSNSFKDLYCQRVKGAAGHTGEVHFTGSHDVRFVTNGNERARFRSDGTYVIGASSDDNMWRGTGSNEGFRFNNNYAASQISANNNIYMSKASGYSDAVYISFWVNGTQLGNINTNGSTISYNTSSDRRLKSNIEDAASASDKIDAIQVRQFDWNADDSHQDYGLIAQELQPIEPLAVTGNADSDEMMGVDYSKLVPMLIKEIQELRGRVAALEAS
jgi:hypothetical protein